MSNHTLTHEKVPVGLPTEEDWRFRYKAVKTFNPVLAAVPAIAGIAGLPIPAVLGTAALAGLGYQAYAATKRPKPLFKVSADEPFINLGWTEDDVPLNIPFDKLSRHMLLLGTTGSGKTTTIRKLLSSVMHMGGGATFVDGKADTTDTYEVFVQIVNDCDRLDDFYVLNFLNPYQSNTFNPLLKGDADFCVEICAGFLPSASGDGAYWQERGLSLMRALMAVLVWLRDNKGQNFSFWDIKESMNLQNLIDLAQRVENPKSEEERIPQYDEQGRLVGVRLISYLNDLGDWREMLKPEPQPQLIDQIIKQHGFAVQQWSAALDLLGGTYSPIFNTHDPDIDMEDIITNGRLLYVLLPSLGKSEATLKQMGKLILSAVTVALSNLLGKETVGETKELFRKVKRNRPTMPHVAILDEYGSYAVDGFSTVLAQARSLNYAVCISAQELGRLMKNKEEGEALVANTNLKIFMKLEDVNTSKIAIERAGKEWALSPGSIRRNYGTVTQKDYVDSWSTQEKERLKILDLAKLRPGQAYFIFEDKLVKFQVPYIKGKPIERLGILKPYTLVKARYEQYHKPWRELRKKRRTKTQTEAENPIREGEKIDSLPLESQLRVGERMVRFVKKMGVLGIPLTAWLMLEMLEKYQEYGINRLFRVFRRKRRFGPKFLSSPRNLPAELSEEDEIIAHDLLQAVLDRDRALGKKLFEKHHVHMSRETKTSREIGRDAQSLTGFIKDTLS